MTKMQIFIWIISIIIGFLSSLGAIPLYNLNKEYIVNSLNSSDIESKCLALKTAFDFTNDIFTYTLSTTADNDDIMKDCYLEVSSLTDVIPIEPETLNVTDKIGEVTSYFYEILTNYDGEYHILDIMQDSYTFIDLIKVEKKINQDILPKVMQKKNNSPSIFDTMFLRTFKDYRTLYSEISNYINFGAVTEYMGPLNGSFAHYISEIVDFYIKSEKDTQTANSLLTNDFFLNILGHSESRFDLSLIPNSDLDEISCTAREILINTALNNIENSAAFNNLDDNFSKCLGAMVLMENIQLKKESETLENIHYSYMWSIFKVNSIDKLETISRSRQRLYNLVSSIYANYQTNGLPEDNSSLEWFTQLLTSLKQSLSSVKYNLDGNDFLPEVLKNSKYIFLDICWLIVKFLENQSIQPSDLEAIKVLFGEVESLIIYIFSNFEDSQYVENTLNCLNRQIFDQESLEEATITEECLEILKNLETDVRRCTVTENENESNSKMMMIIVFASVGSVVVIAVLSVSIIYAKRISKSKLSGHHPKVQYKELNFPNEKYEVLPQDLIIFK